jgi:hypothetical protein
MICPDFTGYNNPAAILPQTPQSLDFVEREREREDEGRGLFDCRFTIADFGFIMRFQEEAAVRFVKLIFHFQNILHILTGLSDQCRCLACR